MKIIKIIELLVKIANNDKVPKKIKYKNRIYIFDKERNDYFYSMNGTYCLALIGSTNIKDNLNSYAEIIEEPKKIKRLITEEPVYSDECKLNKVMEGEISALAKKINEIIDRINSKDSEIK